MFYLNRKKCKVIIIVVLVFLVLYFFGAFTHCFEKDFDTEFHYPYDDNIEELVNQLKNREKPKVAPINIYKFRYKKTCEHKCKGAKLRLVYLVKSASEHFNRRIAIRSSWGFEKRFSDVELRTVFLVGSRNSEKLQKNLDEESARFQDIVQADFLDYYFNNTLKTMMGFYWAMEYCNNSKFYLFVDDDYYVSTKNVLRFSRNPVNYPKYLLDDPYGFARKSLQYDLEDDVRLYAGYVFESSPLRHLSSKWYVSLDEYPYDKWPPYASAGAYLLSHNALVDLYYTSLYTKHFRFDDIYVGLVAFKAKIEPFSCEEFRFHKKTYDADSYKFVIASHGFENYDELLRTWTEQRSLGNA